MTILDTNAMQADMQVYSVHILGYFLFRDRRVCGIQRPASKPSQKQAAVYAAEVQKRKRKKKVRKRSWAVDARKV